MGDPGSIDTHHVILLVEPNGSRASLISGLLMIGSGFAVA
jgi:hypothetical protein